MGDRRRNIMKIICIENKMHNGNFTLNEQYELKHNRITCDFIHILLKKKVEIINGEFEFAFCKFRVIE
jgi:hypothetical protein